MISKERLEELDSTPEQITCLEVKYLVREVLLQREQLEKPVADDGWDIVAYRVVNVVEAE